MQISSIEQSILQAAFPLSEPEGKGKRRQAPSNTKTQAKEKTSYKRTAEFINDILTDQQWHNNMLGLTARWSRLGLTNNDIEELAPAFTRPGHYNDETIRQMKEMINSAKEKFGMGDGNKPTLLSKIFTATTAMPILNADYLIDHIIHQNALSITSGESNTGKTFFILDMAWHIVCGEAWRQYKTKQFSVLYIATEGTKNIQNRIVALRQHYPNYSTGKFNLYVLPTGIDLHSNDDDFDKIKEVIKNLEGNSGTKIGLVIIDTLSRALAGGDENSSSDIGCLIRKVDKLREDMELHVMLIHHKGKTASKGMRGHSKLLCDIDTQIDIVSKDKMSVAFLPKQRDDSKLAKLGFQLKQIEIGKRHEDNEPVTTCVIEIISAVPPDFDYKAPEIKLTQNDELMIKAWNIVAEKSGKPINVSDDSSGKEISEDLWKDAFKKMYYGQNPYDVFSKAIKRLAKKGIIKNTRVKWWSVVDSSEF